MELSDTESSKELEKDEEENNEWESLSSANEPPKITADEMMDQLIKDAKKKSRELQEKSKLFDFNSPQV